jgi:chemotaxis protein methyltransferase CheR
VLDRISDVTEPDGYLVLGGAETVVGLTNRFRPVADRRGLYVPTAMVSGSNVLKLPVAAASAS